jgi:hypothetical protein
VVCDRAEEPPLHATLDPSVKPNKFRATRLARYELDDATSQEGSSSFGLRHTPAKGLRFAAVALRSRRPDPA